jgi:hypothetical protein
MDPDRFDALTRPLRVLHLGVLGVIIIGAAALLAVIGLVAFRRMQRRRGMPHENEVGGSLYNVVGVVYGALLAFIVFAVWEHFVTADEAVISEAAALVAAYRDTEILPESPRDEAQQALRNYVTIVLRSEWTNHGRLVVHTTPDLLNSVWAIYRQVEPTTAVEAEQLAAASQHLYALELQRHLRHLSGESTTLPAVFWPLLLAGGMATVFFSYMLHQDHLRDHAVMTAVLTAVLTGVLFLIYSLNQPFTGLVQISQQPLHHAVAQFDAIDMEPLATTCCADTVRGLAEPLEMKHHAPSIAGTASERSVRRVIHSRLWSMTLAPVAE